MASSKPEKQLSYEQAREQLAEVIEELESGQATLEESMALWAKGEELAAICQAWLDGASKKLSDQQALQDELKGEADA